MSTLRLRIRTPTGPIFDGAVRSIAAEDLDGWFGVRPGRLDLVAALPPGLLVFTDDAGEAFVAHSGGLLDLRREECRVMVREATIDRDLAAIDDALGHRLKERQARSGAQRDVLHDLAREAMRRLVAEARS